MCEGLRALVFVVVLLVMVITAIVAVTVQSAFWSYGSFLKQSTKAVNKKLFAELLQTRALYLSSLGYVGLSFGSQRA